MARHEIELLWAGWLKHVIDESTKIARRFANRKSTRAGRRRSAKISSSRAQRTGKVSGEGTFSRPAFDTTIQVPIGGFKPRFAKAFPMEKPEGLVFRARTHVKNSGKRIKFEGFLSEAVDEVFLDREQKSVRTLANAMGHATLQRLKRSIVKGLSRSPTAGVSVRPSATPFKFSGFG